MRALTRLYSLGVTQLKLSRHPVHLRNVFFPEMQFKHQKGLKPPFVFPGLELSAETVMDMEERHLTVLLTVASQRPTKGEKRSPKAVASFKLRAVALFDCAEFDRTAEAMTAFGQSASPYQLMWPYVRSALAQLVSLSGLPPYHLPLVLAWHVVEEGVEGAAAVKATAQVAAESVTL